MLHSGNESNLRKLLIGRGWGEDTPDGLNTARWEAFINRMQEEGIIQERHWQFVQGVWDLLEQSKPKAQQAHFEVFGYYFDEIAANPIQTPWGEFRGGYVPAQIDADLVVDGQMRELANQENENMDYAFPTTAKGFTKARVEYNRPLVLDLSRLMSHAEQVALFSNMEVPVRDVRRLLSDITPELNRHQHKALESMLMPWLNRAAKQRTVTKIQEDGGFSRFWSVMRQRAGMALMFGNTVNTIQQITGFLLAGVKVKTRYMAAASLDFVSNYKEMQQSVAELSEFMRSRMDNEIAAMDDFIQETLINPNLFQKAQNWTNRNAYFLQQAMANSMEPIIWTAAYRQSLDQGMNEADAAFFADGVIRQTQGSTLPEDISRAEGGTAFVRLTMLIQQLMELQARTPQVPATDNVTGKELAQQIVELSRSLPEALRLLTSEEVKKLLKLIKANPNLGGVELNSAVDSEREDVAATSKAVKTAYDKAVAAEAAASNAEGAVNNVTGKLATKLDTSVFEEFKNKAATKDELGEKVGNLKNQLGGENYRHQMFTASSTFTPPKAGVRLWVLEVDGGKSGGNGSGNWVSGNGGNAGDWRYYQVISTGAQVNVLVGASNSASSVSFSEPKQQMYVFAGVRGGMGGSRGMGGIGARPTSIPVVPILNCPVPIIPGGMGAALYSGEAGGGYGGHGLIIDGHNSVRAGNGLGVNQDRNYYAGDGVGGYGYGAGGGGGGGASSNSLIGRGGNGAGGCVLIWWREE